MVFKYFTSIPTDLCLNILKVSLSLEYLEHLLPLLQNSIKKIAFFLVNLGTF